MGVTEDLMTKISEDVTAAMLRTLALSDTPLPVATAGGAAAAGIIAAILAKQNGEAEIGKPDKDCVLLAGLLIARIGTEHPNAVSQAYKDLKQLSR